MIRRAIAVIAGIALATGALSACISTTSEPKDASGDVLFGENINPAPAPEGEPEGTPPVAVNPLVVLANVDIDTTKFTSPVVLAGWEFTSFRDDEIATVITLVLTQNDWLSFVEQTGINGDVTPPEVQIDDYTANSLYSIDEMAEQILDVQRQADKPMIDIRTTTTYWNIHVP